MLRTIITIDEHRCNGCGLCVEACHEGAIGLENGKAVLLRDDYCDGLGDCLPSCPTGAISFERREAPAYDEAAVRANISSRAGQGVAAQPPRGCPGSAAASFGNGPLNGAIPRAERPLATGSALRQWPVQIRLVPVNAPYFEAADLLVAVDCTAYAHGSFHASFMEGKVTVIGCPKLDQTDYAEKLTAILGQNTIRSVTVVRMSVPCCGGIEHAAKRAVEASGKDIPLRVVTMTPEGDVCADSQEDAGRPGL